MALLRNIASGFRSLVRKEQVERESDEELRGFLEMAVEEKVQRGISRRDAIREVRLERGGLDASKEMVRSAGWESFVETWWQDLRFAGRMLRKNPGFTLVAVLTLGLGIGANTAIFGVVNAVLLRPLAIEDPAHVGYLREQWQDIFPGFSVGNFGDVGRENSSFTEICASHNGGFNLDTQDVPERVDGEYVTANYFATFGVKPIAGRVFTSEEDQPGHPRVALISERLWRTRFGANRAIVGATVRVNGVPTPVVGVMPKSFDPLLSRTDLWIPAAFTAAEFADYDNHYLGARSCSPPALRCCRVFCLDWLRRFAPVRPGSTKSSNRHPEQWPEAAIVCEVFWWLQK